MRLSKTAPKTLWMAARRAHLIELKATVATAPIELMCPTASATVQHARAFCRQMAQRYGGG